MTSDYLASSRRNSEVREELWNATATYQRSIGYLTGKVGRLRCPVCGELGVRGDFDLHEIVTRGLIADKQALMELPVQMHIYVCRVCHDTFAHSPSVRKELWEYTAKVWGKGVVLEAIERFNELLRSPIAGDLIDYEYLRSEDNG